MSRTPRRHGTASGYSGGCRCDECRAGKRRSQTLLRIRMMEGPLKVSAVGVQRRLNSLRAGGWPLEKVAAELGVEMGSMSSLLYKERTTVTVTMHERVKIVFDRLGATPGPSEATRRRAVDQGHFPPLAWTDEALDDPEGEPTGIRTEPRNGRGKLDLDEWWMLVRAGEDPERAAERCGVGIGTVERAAQRAGRMDVAAAASHARNARRWEAAS